MQQGKSEENWAAGHLTFRDLEDGEEAPPEMNRDP